MNIGENLKEKKIILTGGSRGIGLSILEKLCSYNSKVLIIGSNYENLLIAKEKYPSILIEKLNLQDHNKIIENFSGYVEKLGGLDILINNAGITKDNLAIRMNMEEWNKVININLTSSFLLSQQAIKFMIKNKKGSIINISSVVGHTGNPGQVNYSSSKAGMVAMSKTLAREYGKKNIRINCISPGFIKTDMTSVLKDDHKNMLLDQIPLGKMGNSEDISNVVSFLASDYSRYITGETIHVNGGMYMS
jgi:3-oxoacyl-[acyl-carrier protein] reductase